MLTFFEMYETKKGKQNWMLNQMPKKLLLHTTCIYIQTRQYLVGIPKVYQNFLFLV